MSNTFSKITSYTVPSGGGTAPTFSNIPQTYTDLFITVSGRAVGAGSAYQFYLIINGGTPAVAGYGIESSGSARNVYNYGSQVGGIDGAGATANVFSNMGIYISNYANSSFTKSINTQWVAENNNATSSYIGASASNWPSTNSIVSVGFSNTGGNLAAGTEFTLYGI